AGLAISSVVRSYVGSLARATSQNTAETSTVFDPRPPFGECAHSLARPSDRDECRRLRSWPAAHSTFSFLRGSENWKAAPRGGFGATHSRPPCASMIERQIQSPIPMPSGLVV